MNDLEAWLNQLSDLQLPRWDQLPTLDLYMDQVLEYVNTFVQTSLSEDSKVVTAAMINNYVKQKLLPAPHKKKYSRSHLAYIIVISVLKEVLALQDIEKGIRMQKSRYGTEQAFNHFVDQLELTVKVLSQAIVDPTTVQLNILSFEDNLTVEMALVSYVSQKITLYLLHHTDASEEEHD